MICNLQWNELSQHLSRWYCSCQRRSTLLPRPQNGWNWILARVRPHVLQFPFVRFSFDLLVNNRFLFFLADTEIISVFHKSIVCSSIDDLKSLKYGFRVIQMSRLLLRFTQETSHGNNKNLRIGFQTHKGIDPSGVKLVCLACESGDTNSSKNGWLSLDDSIAGPANSHNESCHTPKIRSPPPNNTLVTDFFLRSDSGDPGASLQDFNVH